MRVHIKPFLFGAFVLALFPIVVFARIGVGVGLGEIRPDKPASPGSIYELPSIPVLNTGDEEAFYELGVEYHQDQPQLLPARDWFHFEPKRFDLKPGEVKLVKISLTLPIRTKPGEYFAYIEGRTVQKAGVGGAHIGVAAAAKLYFTVIPASGWEGVRYRVLALYKKYSPWPQVVGVVGVVAIALLLFRRFFSLNLQLNARKQEKNEEAEPHKKSARKTIGRQKTKDG